MSSKYRYYLLGSLSLFGMVVSSAAKADDAPISDISSKLLEDHIIQLEYIVNTHSQLLIQLQQQLSSLQYDIESLRGQIQNNHHQFNQIFGQLKLTQQQVNNLIKQEIPGNIKFNTNTNSTIVPGSVNNTKITVNNDDNAYKQATYLREIQQYNQAIIVLKKFLTQYPKSVYLPNVNYWLGQLYYSKGEKNIAVSYYAFVVKNYPKSAKSADAMLKVGIIMQDKKQTDKAKIVYQQVIKKYPNSQAAIEAQKKLVSF
ncbi:tol-pal system protein YbgF [Candidatus Fukatsuia anoeciicola]|uniref:tol-pal system protein YbgF n=1 Tax=Candidatus Fukatsuia anoeciicola TaxID=2994492 RepID=UPI003463DEA4